ncbi:pyridoxamine 5'-phosphate oxidase-domain-containing protein [Stachybotrys elegans]|uniref:Pyridoxamine 5'-phosphate oxidase-domain-containing protein n=1 Tax=Stachybotrys elegans TaxID=80388 RepID=A0A8K0WLR7_9HYPO|nr:pyridoxamine 5'-phosphate oxidase-domain-containing protein [Stachybotrys elegans]
MKLLGLTAGLCGLAGAVELQTSPHGPVSGARIPTSYESAVMGRRILALSKLATLTTVFPDEKHSRWDRWPDGVESLPVGLMDYVADCEDDGNPTILEIKIGTTFRNARAGSNITASMRWVPPYPPAKRISFLSRIAAYASYLSGGESPYSTSPDAWTGPDTVPYSAANLPRFSLFGYLEPIDPNPVDAVHLGACFTSKHRDAKYWLPGNPIHESAWARLVVTQVYWIGGFGDRAYIGWIPIDEWKKVTKDEWSSIKLPGEEKDWKEWSVDVEGEL